MDIVSIIGAGSVALTGGALFYGVEVVIRKIEQRIKRENLQNDLLVAQVKKIVAEAYSTETLARVQLIDVTAPAKITTTDGQVFVKQDGQFIPMHLHTLPGMEGRWGEYHALKASPSNVKNYYGQNGDETNTLLKGEAQKYYDMIRPGIAGDRDKFLEELFNKPSLFVTENDKKLPVFKHIHIIGSTGDGKTVYALNMLYKLAEKLGNDVDFVIIDPKPEENGEVKCWPKPPAAVESEEAIETLNWIEAERLKRKKGNGGKKPMIVVIDELDDLVADLGDSASTIIRRLAKTGRSLGMYLILIGQSHLVQDTGLNTATQTNFVKIALGSMCNETLKRYPHSSNKPLMEALYAILNEFQLVDSTEFYYALFTPKPGLPAFTQVPFMDKNPFGVDSNSYEEKDMIDLKNLPKPSEATNNGNELTTHQMEIKLGFRKCIDYHENIEPLWKNGEFIPNIQARVGEIIDKKNVGSGKTSPRGYILTIVRYLKIYFKKKTTTTIKKVHSNGVCKVGP